jgi:hypothetical protein
MGLLFEKVEDRGMDGGEFLQGANVPELRHRLFPSAEWLVQVLGPIVQPTATFLPGESADYLHRSMV